MKKTKKIKKLTLKKDSQGLIKLVTDSLYNERIEIINSLSDIGDESSINMIINLIDDQVEIVSKYAMSSLEKMQINNEILDRIKKKKQYWKDVVENKKNLAKERKQREETKKQENKIDIKPSKNRYLVIKMYPLNPLPDLDLLAGGWIPVFKTFHIRGNIALCIFTDYTKANSYKSDYNMFSREQITSLEIASLSIEETRRLKHISKKITHFIN